MHAQYLGRRCVSGGIIQEVGRRLLRKANANVAEHLRMEMSFSNRCLARFQKRWGLKSFKSHGDSGDAAQEALDAAMPVLRSRLEAYNLREIFNADKSGLYYRMAPDITIARQQLNGKGEKFKFALHSCRVRTLKDRRSYS